MNQKHNLIWWPLVLTCSCLALLFSFSYLVTDAGHVMMNATGDGGKNYFTYLYHILYGSGTWFTGMNYPFGEHIVYADGQPLLSIPLAAWHVSATTAIAVMHLLIALSYLLGIIYQFRILLRFRVAPFFALPTALIITFMCPQLLRISGHFALSYASFAPMLFFFTLQYHDGQGKRYLLWLFLLGSIMSFLHPYYVALTIVWCSFYLFSYAVTQKTGLRQKLRHLLPLLCSAVAVVAAMKIFMLLTDPVKDRPAFPHGAMAYGAMGTDILTSAYSPFWKALRDAGGISQLAEGSEGFVYVGLPVIGLVLFRIFSSMLQWRRKKTGHAALPEEREQFPAVWLVLAFSCLLLSMGVPFVWNMEWLLDYLSVFKQFRTLGRFSWLFYELITIYTIVTLYRYAQVWQSQGKKRAAGLLLALPLLVWAIEASGYMVFLRQQAAMGKTTYTQYYNKATGNWRTFLQQRGYDPKAFQAMLLLPFVHIGSEKWSVRGFETGVMYTGFKAAAELQLPIVDVMMSRTSWSQTAQQVRISGGPFADKPLMTATGDKPFLVLCYKKDAISNDEWALLRTAERIGDYADCEVYACYPDKVRQSEAAERRQIAAVAAAMPVGDSLLANDGGILLINHLDQLLPVNALAGPGGLGVIRGADTMLAEIPVPETVAGNRFYEISTWVLMNDFDFRTPYFNLSFTDEQGHELSRKDVLCRQSFDNKGMWFRCSLFFTLPEHCRKIHWRLYDNDHRSYISLDEIVLKPAFATLISKWPDGRIMVNNHLLNLPVQ